MKKNKLLILGAGIMQVPLIKEAKNLNLTSIVIDFDKKAPGIKYADKFYNISTVDFQKILEISIKEKIDGVVTSSDKPVLIAAMIAAKLNKIGPDLNSVTICQNKYLFRKFLKENGFPHPKYEEITKTQIPKNLNYPIITKPVDSSGSRGVKLSTNINQLTENIQFAMQYSNKVILEEYINGREFSIETVVSDNIPKIVAITEKKIFQTNFKSFVEERHIIPAEVNSLEKRMILENVILLHEKLKLNNTITHTELKLFNEKCYFIEIGCRLGGDYITSDLVPISLNQNMLKFAINIALGRKNFFNKFTNNIGMIEFFNSEKIHVFDTILKNEYKYIVNYERNLSCTSEILSSFDRCGFIIFKFPNKKIMSSIISKYNLNGY